MWPDKFFPPSSIQGTMSVYVALEILGHDPWLLLTSTAVGGSLLANNGFGDFRNNVSTIANWIGSHRCMVLVNRSQYIAFQIGTWPQNWVRKTALISTQNECPPTVGGHGGLLFLGAVFRYRKWSLTTHQKAKRKPNNTQSYLWHTVELKFVAYCPHVAIKNKP